ncbi:MAG TPA: COX15/CtaA family protein [Azospira sp.]|nr:COX15/CtaA family protein [Azospira sp.]
MNSPRLALLRSLLRAAACLAAAVVVLGAYVRLSDAGLSCPDWPGCYGQITVPASHDQAAQAFPDRPLHPGKAWKEMLHRYLAACLGLLIAASAALAWSKDLRRQHHPGPATALLGLVVGQGLLGMWTVTLLLKPVIVSAHLLGGMSTLGLLLWLHWRHYRPDGAPPASPWSRLLLLALFLQIGLGGWVSSNYAAPACPDLPACRGQWLPPMDFAQGFALHRELGQTATGEPLSLAALTAIQWSHRLGALLVALLALGRALALYRAGRRRGALALGGALGLQLFLGLVNVVLGWPLGLAVAHNAGAALLLAAALWPQTRRDEAVENETEEGAEPAVSPSAMPPRRAW